MLILPINDFYHLNSRSMSINSSSRNSGQHRTLFESIKHSQNKIARSLSEKIIQQMQEIFNAENSSLLHTAASSSNYEMAEYYLEAYDALIQKCPDKYSQESKIKWLKDKDNEGFTCLHYAVFRGNFKMAQLFEKHGSDIYQINSLGLTVLHIAAQGDSPLLMYYYMNKGIKIGVTDSKGSTPLHWACYCGQENSVYALISWGAEIDKQESTFGMTPLHLATMSGNGRIVKKLLIKGCDRNIKAFNGKLALDIAKQNEYKNITQMIIDKQGIEELMNIKTPFRKLHKKTFPFFMLLVLFSTSYILNISFVVKDSIKSEFVLSIIFLVLGLIVMVLFVGSTFSNPGFLRPSEANQLIKTESKNMFHILNRYKPHQICFDCHIVKPDRSRHCEICNSCIIVYDHHCPWIANCVGANNYWVFFSFLMSIFIYMSFTLAFQIVNLADTDWSDHRSLQVIRIVCEIITLVIVVLFILPLIFLIIVQMKNVCDNKTTFQRYGFQRSNSSSPISQRSSMASSLNNAGNEKNDELKLRLVDSRSLSNSGDRGTGVNLQFVTEETDTEPSSGKNCYLMFCGNRKNIRYQIAI